MFEDEIKKLLKKEVKGEIELEVPPDKALGDYAFPCFQLAKELKKAPAKIAEDIAKKLKPPKTIERIEAKGPYVNFFVSKEALAEKVLLDISYKKDAYGSADIGKGKRVVIDYSSVNIAKPFGIGHLRSTVLGDALYRMHKFVGYKPIGINHLGDWGVQFGMTIAAHLKWGDAEKLRRRPIQYLLDLYIRFNEEMAKKPELKEEAKKWFKKLEDGDAEATKLWAKFRHLSIDEFRRIYDLLGVSFDSYDGEAFYNDKVDSAIRLAEEKGITEESEGALVVKMPEGMPPILLRKSDEATTYAARDLAAALYRLDNYSPEKLLYVVGSEQQLHFKQLFELLKMLGKPAEKFVHVSFGLYRLPEGKMSTRKGKIVFMEEVIARTVQLAKETIQKKNPALKNKDEVARMVGIGAIKFGDLINDRVKDIVFDWNKFLDFEGDTAPYLQYTYARASSIIRKAKEQNMKPETKVDFGLLKDESETALIGLLAKFPQEIIDALKAYKPHIIAQHLIKTGRQFNEFYHKCPVLQEKNKELARARLLLVECSRQVIKNGLGLLGIEAPEEM